MKPLDYRLIISLLTHMDRYLICDNGFNLHPDIYLCHCLLKAKNTCHIYYNHTKEEQWILTRIHKAVLGSISVSFALRVAKGQACTSLEAYHVRKYLIQRWIGEANKILSDSTSSSVVK